MPNARVLKKIAKALNCKVDDLLKDDEVNKLYKTKLIAPGKTTQLYKEN